MIMSKWTFVGWLSAFLISAGIGGMLWFVMTDEEGAPYQFYLKYAADLERLVKLQYIQTTGLRIAQIQLAVVAMSFVMAVLLGEAALLIVTLIAALGPKLHLENSLNKRRLAIDEMLDPFLVALSNALKVSPSLGDALRSTADGDDGSNRLIADHLSKSIFFRSISWRRPEPQQCAYLHTHRHRSGRAACP